ncbi:glycoside hydrolase superfamily [Chytridium lagenaria]|nr:glycoside hydrolase superfamily [Chytridium lagenaria]
MATNQALLFPYNTPWSINDSPAYPHRGLLLDTSRHYIPVPSLLRTIEGLAYSKLNVLHWHIVDSQSFPVVSTSVPGLSVGAYSPFQVYTKEDVGRVVEYAEERGVRVIPEFDVPGHAYSWGRGVEGLTVCDNVQPNWEKYCAAPPCGQIDITKPKNVEIVATLIREMTTWFKDPLFHLGTDEVNSACYSDNPTISSHMSRTSKSVNDLISDFLVSLHTVLFPLSRTPMHWEEAVLEHKANLDKRTIVQTWRKGESVNEILGMGYRVVRADFGAYYLDCGGGGWLERGGKSWCDPYKTWQDMYGFDLVGGVSGELRKGVLGGEVALWTEQSEAHTIDSKIWPRAAAAAESWWTFSDSSQKKVSEALPRLAVFTEKLVSMGIAASPLQPEWCRNGGCA